MCIATIVNIKQEYHSVCFVHMFCIVGIVCEGGNLEKQSCEKMAKCLLEVYKFCVSEGVHP